MLSKALFLLLLATGTPPGDIALEPSALATQAAVPLRADLTLGAWQGILVDTGGSQRPLEMSIADGLRRDTVFGYFRFGSQGHETTVRRMGRVGVENLVFDLREGGRIALRLLAGRLVGDVVDPAGQFTTGHGTLDLARVHP